MVRSKSLARKPPPFGWFNFPKPQLYSELIPGFRRLNPNQQYYIIISPASKTIWPDSCQRWLPPQLFQPTRLSFLFERQLGAEVFVGAEFFRGQRVIVCCFFVSWSPKLGDFRYIKPSDPLTSWWLDGNNLREDTPLKINILHIIPWRFASDHDFLSSNWVMAVGEPAVSLPACSCTSEKRDSETPWSLGRWHSIAGKMAGDSIWFPWDFSRSQKTNWRNLMTDPEK